MCGLFYVLFIFFSSLIWIARFRLPDANPPLHDGEISTRIFTALYCCESFKNQINELFLAEFCAQKCVPAWDVLISVNFMNEYPFAGYISYGFPSNMSFEARIKCNDALASSNTNIMTMNGGHRQRRRACIHSPSFDRIKTIYFPNFSMQMF